jgi:hypothetical protein
MRFLVYRSVVFGVLCFVSILFTSLVFVQNIFAQESVTPTSSAEVILVEEDSKYQTERIPGGDSVIGDFVVGPGKIDVTLNPGESKIVEMLVTNRTGERRVFNLTTEDMTGSNDLTKPVVLLGGARGPYSLKDYLIVPDRSFELGQNERARIPVTISIPPDAEPGGLYGSMLVDTVAIEADSGVTNQTVPQSAIVARIGTLFFVTVSGEIVREARMSEFGTLGKKKFYGNGPIPFGILHENTGSMHIVPYGEVRITNMLGEEVGFVELEPWFVLPQSERLREITWNRDLLFGRYTATAQINRGYDDVIDTLSVSFWVLPWKLVTGAFGILFFTLFLIRLFFRTFEFKRR